jgi:site-specific recombinase XerD
MADIALISRFIEYLDSERNFSAHTVRSYCSDLLGYCRFLAAEGPTSELSARSHVNLLR